MFEDIFFKIFLLFASCHLLQALSWTLTNPFTLTADQLSISTINTDPWEYYLVSFTDSQARYYTPDFSSYTPLIFHKPVQQFESSLLHHNDILFSNGTIWNMNGAITAALANNFTSFNIYTLPNFNYLESYAFTKRIVNYIGLPVTKPNGDYSPVHFLVFPNSMQAAFKSRMTLIFYLKTSIAGSSYISAATSIFSSTTISGDNIQTDLEYLIAVAPLGLYRVFVKVSLSYNFSTDSYHLSSALPIIQSVAIFSTGVVKMIADGGVVLAQLQDGTFMIYDCASAQVSKAPIQDSFIGSDPISSMMYVNNQYFVLYSRGLVEFSIFSGQYQASALVSSLPNNTYSGLAGPQINILYLPNSPFLYKGDCEGQMSLIPGTTTCINYTCSISNCIECLFAPSICSLCADGYVRDDIAGCVRQKVNLIDKFLEIVPGLKNASKRFYNYTKYIISIPAARSIMPIFYYFGNFDDLQLYMYHDRLYGSTMQDIFWHINDIENAKWALIDIGFNDIGIGNATLSQSADYQGEYLTYNYSIPGRQSQGSQGLIANCGNFLIFGMSLTLGAFIILHICFKALFLRRCSLLLRKFHFWGYFLVLVFEGNVQQFAFYLAAEWRHFATFALWHRGVKTAVFLFGFVTVAVAVGGALVMRAFYGRLNRHLADNNRNTLRGSTLLLLQGGIRNFLLGILHCFLRAFPYETILSLLICVEVTFLIIFVAAVPLGAYRTLHSFWAAFLLSILRILLISTLFLDYGNVGETLVETLQSTIIIIMLTTYFIVTVISVIEFIFNLVKTIKRVIFPSDPSSTLWPQPQRQIQTVAVALMSHRKPLAQSLKGGSSNCSLAKRRF